MIILFRTVYDERPNSTKITKDSSLPSSVCHNIMKLSFRLFWTTDACREPPCIVGNITGECILPFNLASIGKSRFGFTSAYWRSDIAHGWKILPFLWRSFGKTVPTLQFQAWCQRSSDISSVLSNMCIWSNVGVILLIEETAPQLLTHIFQKKSKSSTENICSLQ